MGAARAPAATGAAAAAAGTAADFRPDGTQEAPGRGGFQGELKAAGGRVQGAGGGRAALPMAPHLRHQAWRVEQG